MKGPMNKTRFFKLCDQCDQTLAHQLRLAVVRASGDLDKVIELYGSMWCRGGLASVEVYRPLPGRQGQGLHPYQEANARIKAALPKFQRWLEEWKVLRDIPAELTPAEDRAEAEEYSRRYSGEEPEEDE